MASQKLLLMMFQQQHHRSIKTTTLLLQQHQAAAVSSRTRRRRYRRMLSSSAGKTGGRVRATTLNAFLDESEPSCTERTRKSRVHDYTNNSAITAFDSVVGAAQRPRDLEGRKIFGTSNLGCRGYFNPTTTTDIFTLCTLQMQPHDGAKKEPAKFSSSILRRRGGGTCRMLHASRQEDKETTVVSAGNERQGDKPPEKHYTTTAMSTTTTFERIQKTWDKLRHESSNDNDDSSRSQRTMESYHLLWSRDALKKIAGSTAALAVFHGIMMFVQPTTIAAAAAAPATTLMMYYKYLNYSFTSNIVLPMGASACCIMQLWLNFMGVGCGGFNTYLGPARPYFMASLLYLSFLVYPPTTWLATTVFVGRFALALLPEMIHVWNTYQSTKSINIYCDNNNPQSFPPTIRAKVDFSIPTMGCVACINKINSSLTQAAADASSSSSSSSSSGTTSRSGVLLEYSSWLNAPPKKGGQASVLLTADNRAELDELVERLQCSIQKAGFGGSSAVVSLQIISDKNDNPPTKQPPLSSER